MVTYCIPRDPFSWTPTGWERVDATVIAPGRAFQQSWFCSRSIENVDSC